MDTTTNVVTIIPVKPLSEAKSRLAPFLNKSIHGQLVLNMLLHVVKIAVKETDAVWILSTDDSIKKLARSEGAQWCHDPKPSINQSLEFVFKQVWDEGKFPLFLPGDLPFLRNHSLKQLIYRGTQKESVVLVPAKKDGGTNAIFIPKFSAFRFLLGPNSFERHLTQAKFLGLDPIIYRNRSIALDLDTWEDMKHYKRMAPDLFDILTHGAD